MGLRGPRRGRGNLPPDPERSVPEPGGACVVVEAPFSRPIAKMRLAAPQKTLYKVRQPPAKDDGAATLAHRLRL